MADFAIPEDLASQLEWTREFVPTEIEPLDHAFGAEAIIYDKAHPIHERAIRPLQERVREKGLWSCHLTPEFGGQGYGQVRLAISTRSSVDPPSLRVSSAVRPQTRAMRRSWPISARRSNRPPTYDRSSMDGSPPATP
jgi:alkylation response protein AidB-like acyl-CoA dehydrogenase